MKSALLTAFVVLCVAVLVAGQLSFSKHGFEVEEGSPGFKSYSNEEVRGIWFWKSGIIGFGISEPLAVFEDVRRDYEQD